MNITDNEYEALKQELRLVADASPMGSHREVADKIGYSSDWLKKVRNHGMLKNSDENVKIVKKVIQAYRRINTRKIKELTPYSNIKVQSA